jgi:hypothetical protein
VLVPAQPRPDYANSHAPSWAVRCIRERCPEEISEVAALPKGGLPASQRWRGARSQRGPGVQRVWHAAGTFSSYGSMVRATTSLLSRGPLGVRRWAGRSMCDSLVRRARASSGPGRLGGARARHILHTHQAERAAEPVQSRRSACRASLLMRLSSDVRRCREELPEAARRRLPWLITAARRQAAHSPV